MPDSRCQYMIGATSTGPDYCHRPCEKITLQPPADRDPISESRCSVHGGTERATELLAQYWSMLAPASVGGDWQVLHAGAMHLDSTHYTIVVQQIAYRETPAAWHIGWQRDAHDEMLATVGVQNLRMYGMLGRSWTVGDPTYALGIAAQLWGKSVEHVASVTTVTAAQPPKWRDRWSYGIGEFGFTSILGESDSKDAAIEAGRKAWRENLDAYVAEIKAARGGTLAWGLTIDPPTNPNIEVRHAKA